MSSATSVNLTGPSQTLVELIATLESAEKPHHSLNHDMALHAGYRVKFGAAGGGCFVWAEPGENYSYGTRPPRYSESMDAAATLVPSGFDWCVQTPGKYAQVWKGGAPHYEGNGATMALGICIAALKARLANATQLNQERQP